MSSLIPNSIRSRLMLAFVSLAAGPLLLAGVLLGWHSVQSNVQSAQRLELELARHAAGHIEEFFKEVGTELQGIAAYRSFLRLAPEEQRRLLEELLFRRQRFQELSLLDGQGRERIRLSKAGIVLPEELRDRAATEEFAYPKRTGLDYYGPIRYEPSTGEPLMDVAIPLQDPRSGQVEGVLVAQVRMKAVWFLIAELQREAGEHIYLLDAQDRVIAHNDVSVVLRETRFPIVPGTSVRQGLMDKHAILATAPVKVGQEELRVVAERAAMQALKPAFQSLSIIIWIVTFTLAAAGLLIWMAERRIVRPIREVAAAALAIRDGDLERRAHVVNRDEIGAMADAFNAMTARLRSNLQLLEQEIRERQQTEAVVREKQQLLSNIIDTIPQYVFWKDSQLVYLGCNRKFAQAAGIDSPEDIVGKTDYDLPWPDSHAECYRQADREVIERGEPRLNFEEPIDMASGVAATVLTSKTPLRAADGEIFGVLGIFSDITERKQLEESLRQLSQAVEQSPVSVVITDLEGVVRYVNARFVTVTGYAAEDLVGHAVRAMRSGILPTAPEIWRRVGEGREWRGEFQTCRKNGELLWEYVLIAPIKTPEGRTTHVLAIKEDISLRKSYEERLLRQANYDALTGLPNRALTMDRLGKALEAARRYKRIVGLLFIDLDQFKFINDTRGHHVGDLLLKDVAQRLMACVRAEDTVGRMGGDEFTIILPQIDAPTHAERVAAKVLEVFKAPFVLEGYEVFTTPTIGIAVYPSDGDNPQALLQHADAAMYQAKELGRNNFHFFTPALNQKIRERGRIETCLRHALVHNELALHYQPLIYLGTDRLCGVETLLQWHHPELGQVSPDQFIPIAEEVGLIGPIGDWVLITACKQWQEWREQGLDIPRIAVNVSSRQFRDGHILRTISQVMDECGLPPFCLELEITESLLMNDVPAHMHTLRALHEMGVRLSVDDFGTGYSSLGYLKRFPINTLKIDKSFVRDVDTDQGDAALVEAIISMARSLRLEVVAEGVETASQADFLRSHRCDIAQGYYFGRPVPAASLGEQVQQYLAERRATQTLVSC